jgi:hypothetical protein
LIAVWRWSESTANPSHPNSLFNRENTGNFSSFEDQNRQNTPDLPVIKGFQEFALENGTGNFKEVTGNNKKLSGNSN